MLIPSINQPSYVIIQNKAFIVTYELEIVNTHTRIYQTTHFRKNHITLK